VRVSNSGNVAATEPFTVTAYDDSGGVIGGFSVDTLEGCGNVAEGIVTWPDLEPGTHPIRVRVDSSNQIIETDEADNEKASTVLVASFQAYLPAVSRRGH
jgi:subtilase family serine protease